MKLVTKLRFFLLLMLSLCLIGVVLSVWSVQRARIKLDRINLAHISYESFLSLKSHTYQLFKEYGDTFIIGVANDEISRHGLISDIRADIVKIRETIGKEITLVGQEEIEELAAFSNIEQKLEKLIATLERLSTDTEPDSFNARWGELSHILDSEIDQDFRVMIDDALAEEAQEITETREQAFAQFLEYQIMAGVFALIAIAAAFASLWTLRYQVSRPAEQLLKGVRMLSHGDMDYRINLTGQDELATIGSTLDIMAERIGEETRQLASKNSELDQAVKDRTVQLEELLGDAKQNATNRRRMLADVSHELRTPLTIIQGEADIALRGDQKTPEVYQDALTRTRDAARHTAHLVDDLLFMARNEAGEPKLNIESLDLREILNDVAKTFGHSQPVHTNLNAAPIRGDVGRLRQAFLILLQNASVHGGQHIELRLDRTSDGYRAVVEDDGPGLSDADKVSCFQRFYRGSNAATQYSEGVGLGLPVALSIAQAHGGTITLKDRSGGGLSVVVDLPTHPKLKAVA